jgi:hypothetical protein
MSRSQTSPIPRRSPIKTSPPNLRTLKKWGSPPRKLPRDFTIRSPVSFIHRTKQRRKANEQDSEIAAFMQQFGGTAASTVFNGSITKPTPSTPLPTPSVETQVDDAMPWLQEEEDFMQTSPEKEIKPPDKFFCHYLSKASWIPPLRAMSTLTHVPSVDIRADTRNTKVNRRGYSYLFFGIGQTRSNVICELDMNAYVWRNIKGTNEFGTPFVPDARAGHVACYLNQGRILIYGGEANPNTRKSKHIIGRPLSTRKFVPGPVNMLVFNVNTYVWERYQPRISPGARYLASLTRLTKKEGNHLLLFGGATVVVKKKKKEATNNKNKREEQTQAQKQTQENGNDPPKEETFVSEWELKNDVWCLNQDTMKWWLPQIAGIQPTAKMGHTATESSVGSLFVIGGTRGLQKKKDKDDDTDDKYDDENNSAMDKIDDDFTIWELVTTCTPMHWTRIQSTGINPRKRLCHTTILSPWDNTTLYIFGGNLEEEHNLLTFDTSTSVFSSSPHIGSTPATRYGHTCVLTDSQFGQPGKLSAAHHPTLSSSLEQRQIKMWLVGGSGRTGFEPLHVYEMAINPPACLLEQRGRWQHKVSGHWNYQKQRLLTKPFFAWQEYIQRQRRNHILAEHDDVLAARIPLNSSYKYTSTFTDMLREKNKRQVDGSPVGSPDRQYNVKQIQSFGSNYNKFKRAMSGPNVRNRVVHLSSHGVLVSRAKQMTEEGLDNEILLDAADRQHQRELDGTEAERNHESGSASILENMLKSVIVSGSASVLAPSSRRSARNNRESAGSRRPRSSPGGRRAVGSNRSRPSTAF